jgi:5-methylcytosine-specific restriction endonuclease McrA
MSPQARKHSEVAQMPRYSLEELQTTCPELDSRLRKAYDEHLLSEQWDKKKQKVRRRDGKRCQVCGDGKTLETHHLTYERVFVEKLSDLILLCSSCHRKVHRGKI